MSHSANSIPPADPLLGLPCGRIDATGGNSVCHRPWIVLFCFLTFYLLPTLPDGIVVDSGDYKSSDREANNGFDGISS